MMKKTCIVEFSLKTCAWKKRKNLVFLMQKKIKMSMVVDFPADFPLYLGKFMFIS